MTRLTNMRVGLAHMPVGIAISYATQAERDVNRAATQPWREWYNSRRWRKLRKHVLMRDKYVCQKTNVFLGHAPHLLVAHHKKPHHGDSKLFWDENNIETVTKKYHDSVLQSIEKNNQLSGKG